MSKKESKVKIMVASSVQGFEQQLDAVVSQLTTMGFEVINSHSRRMKVNPKLTILQNCLKAVEECDLFLGIINPYSGEGYEDGKNITFEEFKRIIELGKPYWFLAHRHVIFAQKLFKKLKCSVGDSPQLISNKLVDKISIEMYEYIIQDNTSLSAINNNWAQEFYRESDILEFIQTQFGDKSFVEGILKSTI